VTLEQFLATQFSSLAGWIRAAAMAGAGARIHERDGVVAQVSPSIPGASLFNSVTYRDADALKDALPELSRTYAEAGVQAWTVWIHERDAEASAAVRDAGHVLDATPEGMGCLLADLVAPDGIEELEYTENPSVEDLQMVLSQGYDFPLEVSKRATAAVPVGPATIVGLAHLEGRPACTVQVTIADGDAGVFAVATAPGARGRGLARRLQYVLLQRARERGAKTTTLQASPMGRGVYAALGYSSFGAMNMWERRQPSPTA
jgi:GNAT superfamily N-acetyltransferase